MNLKKFLTSLFIAGILPTALIIGMTGCSFNFYKDIFADGKIDQNTSDQMFIDDVHQAIELELNGPHKEDKKGWHHYWLSWCEDLHYNPNLGDSYVQYISVERRKAGLPDIPEITNLQFRTQWKIFTDSVDDAINKEVQNLPAPPPLLDAKLKGWTWPEYWTSVQRLALYNPAVSTNGVEYIKSQRKQFGLKPLDN